MQKAYVAWYLEDDWPEWLRICPGFIPSYPEWRRRSEIELPELRQTGISPEPITIRPNGFRKWAAANNRRRAQESIGAYVVALATGQCESTG